MSGLLSPAAALRELSDLGLVLAGCKLHTYVSGTPATDLATYTDAALTIPSTNPIIASAGGLLPAFYLTKGVAYKYVLTDASDVTIWTRDPVLVPNAPTLAAGAGISLAVVGDTTTISASSVATVDVNDFRLTLESGVPVSSTDQTAKTSVFATPVGSGNQIDVFDALGVPTRLVSAEVSIALPAVASQVYDVFAYSNAGVLTLELLAWTNDTTRATALVVTTTGAYTKSGDLTRRYLGTVRTTTVVGQTEDSLTKRYLWNAYHQVPRALQRYETNASWTYQTATVRQARADVTNQVEIVVGLPGTPLDLALMTSAEGGGARVSVGIGEDSLTTYVVGQTAFLNSSGSDLDVRLVKTPAIGRHVYSWNEWSQAVGTTTWSGAVAAMGSNITSGLTGWIEG